MKPKPFMPEAYNGRRPVRAGHVPPARSGTGASTGPCTPTPTAPRWCTTPTTCATSSSAGPPSCATSPTPTAKSRTAGSCTHHRPGHHLLQAPLLRRPHMDPHPAHRARAGEAQIRLPHNPRRDRRAHLPRLHQALRPEQGGQAGGGGRENGPPMEDLPEISGHGAHTDSYRYHGLPARPRVQRARAVFPAVEAMRVLAESALARIPGLDVRVIERRRLHPFPGHRSGRVRPSKRSTRSRCADGAGISQARHHKEIRARPPSPAPWITCP